MPDDQIKVLDLIQVQALTEKVVGVKIARIFKNLKEEIKGSEV